MPNTLVKRVTFGLLSPILAMLLILGLSLPAFAQPKPQVDLTGKNILILHSHETNAPVFLGTDKGLSNTLQSGGIPSLNQFFQSLDLRRNPGPEHRKLLVEQMRMRYGHRKLDLIITMYPEAMEFVLKDCRNVLPDVPILALYLPQGMELPKTDRNITGHSVSPDIVGTLEIALKLVPGAKRVYVVSGAHEVDRRIEDLARHISKKWEGQLEFLYLSHMPFEDILATVSSVPPGSIILALAFSQDVTGKNQLTPEVVQRLSQVSTAPIFGILDVTLGRGITGGSLISFERIGTRAGQLALNILRGIKTAENIPDVLDVPCVPMFDWRQLRRWNLSVSALPKGSIVINRELTVWDFKYYIIGGLAFVLLETALIIFLVVQRRRRKVAEEALEEQLRFERLVSDISARFVNMPPDRVASEIERGLKEILDFFQADRCALLRILADKTSWEITHVAAQEGVPPVPQGTKLPVSINPWAYDKLIQKREVLSVSRLDDLPPEASVDKQTWIEWGIRSNLNIPIIIGGPVDHVFAINWVKSERGWPEEFIPRLRLLGEILVNALERRQIRLQIEERLRFEGLISSLSAGFVNLPPDKFESQINRELRSITEFFDVDRCSIGLFSEDGTQLARAFEYHSAEAEPAPESVSKEQIPWYIEQLIQGKPVVMNRVEDLPPEAEKEHQLCLAKGMKSLLAVPMLTGGKTLGSCALVSTRAERVWPEELVKRFRLISEVFANALERKRAEVEVARARAELLHVERFMRVNEMTASLAHELNQPLAAILSNAQAALRFLKSDKPDLGEFQEILQDIISDDQRAGNVIRSLRSMMKREEVGEKPDYSKRCSE